jgi:AcrR family transcriptional regulator
MPVKRADTVEAILAGAENAFAERGFHGASIGYICERAGKTTGAFYSNWSSKLDLFMAVYQRHTDAIAEEISERLTLVEPGPDVLSGLADAFTDIATGDYDPRWLSLNVEFRLLCLRDEDAAKALAGYERRFIRRLGDQVDDLLAASGTDTALSGQQMHALVGALVRGVRLDHGVFAGTDEPALLDASAIRTALHALLR